MKTRDFGQDQGQRNFETAVSQPADEDFKFPQTLSGRFLPKERFSEVPKNKR